MASRACHILSVADILKTGVTIVQYRDKHSDTGVLIETAKKLHKLTQAYNVPLIINDRVDVALAVGAEGVHLGQDDMSMVPSLAVQLPSLTDRRDRGGQEASSGQRHHRHLCLFCRRSQAGGRAGRRLSWYRNYVCNSYVSHTYYGTPFPDCNSECGWTLRMPMTPVSMMEHRADNDQQEGHKGYNRYGRHEENPRGHFRHGS